MTDFKIGEKVRLLVSMPFELSKGDICVITNKSTSITPNGYKAMYHIKKDIDTRYEFRVEENEITKCE